MKYPATINNVWKNIENIHYTINTKWGKSKKVIIINGTIPIFHMRSTFLSLFCVGFWLSLENPK